MSISIDVNQAEIKAIIGTFNKLSKKMNNLSEYWSQYARPILIEEIKEVFDTEGYGRWKAREDQTDPDPLLIDTRKLYNSWTKPGAPYNINRLSNKTFTWGTNLPYAKYHEYQGTTPKRSVIEPVTRSGGSKNFKRKLNQSFGKYLFKDL